MDIVNQKSQKKGDRMEQNTELTPKEARMLIREGKITEPTSGMCPGFAQANLVILPKELAYDFLLFAERNPKPCPILEVSDAEAEL